MAAQHTQLLAERAELKQALQSECQAKVQGVEDVRQQLSREKDALQRELQQLRQGLDRKDEAMQAAEKNRVLLLRNFAGEMDRMRDEIRKLYASKRQ